MQDLDILVGFPYPAGKDKGRGVGLLQEILEFLAAVIGIDRDQNSPHPRAAELGVDPFGQIVCPDGHLVPPLDPKRHQPLGDGIELIPEFPEVLPDIKVVVFQPDIVPEVFSQNIYNVADGRFTHFNVRFVHLLPLDLKVKMSCGDISL